MVITQWYCTFSKALLDCVGERYVTVSNVVYNVLIPCKLMSAVLTDLFCLILFCLISCA